MSVKTESFVVDVTGCVELEPDLESETEQNAVQGAGVVFGRSFRRRRRRFLLDAEVGEVEVVGLGVVRFEAAGAHVL